LEVHLLDQEDQMVEQVLDFHQQHLVLMVNLVVRLDIIQVEQEEDIMEMQYQVV